MKKKNNLAIATFLTLVFFFIFWIKPKENLAYTKLSNTKVANNLPPNKKLTTKNVIIVIIDGPRYSETWGDNSHKYIPNLDSLVKNYGTVHTSFYNNGSTLTIPGHTAITTGHYQKINNSGKELPAFPSLFQEWIKKNNAKKEKAWIITSKDKLEVLANTKNKKWSNKFMPSTDCGKKGLGSGYRNDSITFNRLIKTLNTHHPNLVLVNFREPDYSGHSGVWKDYLKGIVTTDKYINELWKFISSDSFYKNTTTLFVSNDHGRHLDGVKDEFKNHGDNCAGCKHINLFTFGPDFKKKASFNIPREQIDITATICYIMKIDMPHSSGKIMTELFTNIE